MQMLNNQVAIEPLQASVSKGGVLLPNGAGEDSLARGKVLKIPKTVYRPGVSDREDTSKILKEGDTVLYSKRFAYEVEVNGVKFEIVDFEHIKAVA